MAGEERLTPALARLSTVVQPCWMCGIRLPADQMVADGGGACADIRWYCLDARRCTDRWITRWARPADIGHGTSETSRTRDQQLAGPDVARTGPVSRPPTAGARQPLWGPSTHLT